VRPFERIQRAKAIAAFLAEYSETEADNILRACGAAVTPSGWGDWSRQDKVQSVVSSLLNLSDDTLVSLEDFLPDDQKLPPPIQITETERLGAGPSTHAERSPNEGNGRKEMSRDIFVVHGHARGALHEAVRVLERGTDREVIVLHEQPNAGRTILEKFEDHAGDAAFAVVLLTGDDQGGTKAAASMTPRARQNVIFELGFF
jgi:Predicted nucleotide-binding protein containing TIR-like domain